MSMDVGCSNCFNGNCHCNHFFVDYDLCSTSFDVGLTTFPLFNMVVTVEGGVVFVLVQVMQVVLYQNKQYNTLPIGVTLSYL